MVKQELEQVYQQECQRIYEGYRLECHTILDPTMLWNVLDRPKSESIQYDMDFRGETNTRSKSTHCAFQNFNLKEFASTVCHLFPRSMYLRVLHYLLDCDVTNHDIIVNIFLKSFF